ncbi:MAG: PilT protein [Tardiphaga sp.]|nr:PilT protein [Tardiphaga sp.]
MDQRGPPLIVLDASITVALLLNEPGFKASELNEVLAKNQPVVPAHWPIEVGNALLTAVRRKRIDGSRLAQVAAELRKLNVMVEPPTALDRLTSMIKFAADQGLTLYDAAYVDLSMTKNATLATLDKAMRQAAGRLDLNVLPI